MRLYIMRHGETDWNKIKQLQGKSDVPLNDFGRMLARKTAEALEKVPFDLVITSPLSRARETALIVKGEREIPLIEDARIEEMSFGIYEGLCCKIRFIIIRLRMERILMSFVPEWKTF